MREHDLPATVPVPSEKDNSNPEDAAIVYREYFDSPNTRPLNKQKRHYTDRFVIHRLLVKGWSNAKCAHVAYLTGRGYLSHEIEKILNDGTIAATIRGQWRRWGLPIPEKGGKRCYILPVVLTLGTRTKLSARARKVGISPDEWIRRVLLSAIDDDLYVAVTDGRFDPKPEGKKSDC